jgi:hypothetical protein
MANKISFTGNKATDGLVPATSRYSDSRVLRYGDANRLTFEIYKRRGVTTSSEDKVSVIPPGLEYRPDLMSFRAYGTPDFWWRILEANSMMDIFEFKSGTPIIIPSNTFQGT